MLTHILIISERVRGVVLLLLLLMMMMVVVLARQGSVELQRIAVGRAHPLVAASLQQLALTLLRLGTSLSRAQALSSSANQRGQGTDVPQR